MSNVTILIVEKTGTIKEQVIKFTNEEELYKKAGFKTNAGFKVYTEWNIDNLKDKQFSIRVYGKTKGQANQENKYEFPPPIDNTLFFGSCIIMNYSDNKPKDITLPEWETIYEHLFGGFEDIKEEDTEDEEDMDEDEDLPTTKYGYVKDGFVVDDDEEDDEDAEEEEDVEEEVQDEDEVYVVKKKKTAKSKTSTKRKSTKTTKKIEISNDLNILECTDELNEEEYV